MCKALQDNEVCIVGTIEAVLKTAQAITSLQTVAFEDLTTVKNVLARVQKGSGLEVTYQGANLARYGQGVAFLQAHKNEYAESVVSCLKELKVQHCDVLSHALSLLATQGWEKPESVGLITAALESLSSHFKVPLERSGVDCSVLQEEWDDMSDYAKCYLSLTIEDNRTIWWKIWWKLFNAANASKWGNALSLVEFLFCFPMANGRLERVFSSLKLIKTDRRNRLGEDRLDHLVRFPPVGCHRCSTAVVEI